MLIDITKLKSGLEDSIEIHENVSFDKEQLKSTDLISLDNVVIKGYLDLSHDVYHIDVEVSGTMVLPCAITLEPVQYPFSFQIDENLEEDDEFEVKKYKNNEKTIDIFPIIWENILMEIPMKVVSEKAHDVHLEGDGWKLITDEEVKTSSPFEKLNDLLK